MEKQLPEKPQNLSNADRIKNEGQKAIYAAWFFVSIAYDKYDRTKSLQIKNTPTHLTEKRDDDCEQTFHPQKRSYAG